MTTSRHMPDCGNFRHKMVLRLVYKIISSFSFSFFSSIVFSSFPLSFHFPALPSSFHIKRTAYLSVNRMWYPERDAVCFKNLLYPSLLLIIWRHVPPTCCCLTTIVYGVISQKTITQIPNAMRKTTSHFFNLNNYTRISPFVVMKADCKRNWSKAPSILKHVTEAPIQDHVGLRTDLSTGVAKKSDV